MLVHSGADADNPIDAVWGAARLAGGICAVPHARSCCRPVDGGQDRGAG